MANRPISALGVFAGIFANAIVAIVDPDVSNPRNRNRRISGAALKNLANSIVPVDKAASYTFVAGDDQQDFRFTGAGAQTLTIPTEANVPLALGTVINVLQYGAGALTIAGAGGVTLRSPTGFAVARYQWIRLHKLAANEWVVCI